MGCKYCGDPIPPNTGRGPKRKYCSEWCCQEWWREHRRRNKKMEHCKNCGRILKYSQKVFCSEECQERYEADLESDSLQMAGINRLRFAILKQAKADGVLERFIKKEHFYQLYPELTPDILKSKGETL